MMGKKMNQKGRKVRKERKSKKAYFFISPHSECGGTLVVRVKSFKGLQESGFLLKTRILTLTTNQDK